jgi:Ner family transcriptional regulator
MRRMRGQWDRHAILAAVKRRGGTLTKIATDAGLERSACRVAMLRRHRKGEAAIAAFLTLPVSVLWPDRYRGAALHSRSATGFTPAASQKAEAV